MNWARLGTYEFGKRVMDVLVSAAALVLLLPVMAVVALAVAVALGRPVIFAQQRPGLHGRIFTLYKFRSMKDVDERRGLRTNAERMTALGRLLRSTSLDELPSLWNIVRGDLSLVGPRPLRIAYLSRYSDEQRGRHAVRPGLTGLAQVRGRNAVDWDERIALDLEYVKHRSLGLDLWILAATVGAVLRREEVDPGGGVGMGEFLGPKSTSRVRLELLAERHLPTRVAWLNAPEVRRGITIDFVADLDTTRAWFARIRGDASRTDLVGVDPREGTIVSMCGLAYDGSGEAALYLFVDPRRTRQRLGRDTMTLLIARARDEGLRALVLETGEANAPARALYESLGFVDAGGVGAGKRRMRLPIDRGHRDA